MNMATFFVFMSGIGIGAFFGAWWTNRQCERELNKSLYEDIYK